MSKQILFRAVGLLAAFPLIIIACLAAPIIAAVRQ